MPASESPVLDVLESIESDDPNVKKALDFASDSVAFVETLFSVFVQNGFLPADREPTLADLEVVIDCVFGELTSASLFLSDPNFARVPGMLRAVESQLAEASEPIPPVVLQGFGRLATRIENTRLSTSHFKSLLGNKLG